MEHRSSRTRFRGWPVTGWASLLLAMAVCLTLLAGGASEASFHRVIRLTARASVTLFLLAFTASSARQILPSPATAWLVQNRRYVGVSFAASHFLHLGAILGVAVLWPARSIAAQPFAAYAPGATAYLAIAVMAATSSDRSVRWMGARRWRAVHALASYWIWLSFVAAYVPRAMHDLAYLPVAVLLVAAVVARFTGARLRPPSGRARGRG